MYASKLIPKSVISHNGMGCYGSDGWMEVMVADLVLSMCLQAESLHMVVLIVEVMLGDGGEPGRRCV